MVAASREGKTPEDVRALLDAGVYDMQVLKDGDWVTDLKYADQVEEMLKERTGISIGSDKPKCTRMVAYNDVGI